MANRNYYKPIYTTGPRRIIIAGSFACPASSAGVTASTVKGLGFGYAPLAPSFAVALKPQPGNNPTPSSTPGITYVSAGTYLLTLEDPYLDFDSYGAWLSAPAAGTNTNLVNINTAPTGFNTSGTGPAFTIVTAASSGTPTDLGATFRVNFHIFLRDSSVQFGKP